MSFRILKDPSLADALALHKKEILLGLNCHAVATVQEFNSAAQTIRATIVYQKSYTVAQADGTPGVDLRPYPVLVDVPVIVISGGAAALTMPIAKGDECLILFNDRDMDDWYVGATNKAPRSSRLHSFSDGVALIGLNSKANVITNYDAERAVLRNAAAMVAVGAEKIEISNATKNLATILQNLVTALAGATTTNAAVGVPCALSPATITLLNQVGTDLAGLLE